ncbi:MAG: 3-isopropylmalate dehydratase small subunit [Actinomycetota bacterium]|jgi:3-isopropylmalate/(R)-2-methylmalate dehydratase small subunit|nr:3-isopropylmalate dehydratase small subunit [Actinomycetota bacterium]
MRPIKEIRGTGLPLERSDVDTDQIIPSEWLKRVERTGFGAGLFEEWREDPDFVLNDPVYKNAKILVAGPNFGTGSSREHAVWALTDYGFEAVISPRFGDIFRNNSTKAGLVPIVLTQAEVDSITEQIKRDPATEIIVDVAARTVSVPAAGLVASFPLDDFTQYRLLEGLDDIGLTLRSAQEITDYESQRKSWLPAMAT